MNKPCIVCGEITQSSRCEEHTLPSAPHKGPRPRDRVTRANRAPWKNLSARLRRLQPWCSRCGATSDLTVDHIKPLAEGGDPYELSNLQVLCRPCNSAKGGGKGSPGMASDPLGEAQRPLHTPGGYA